MLRWLHRWRARGECAQVVEAAARSPDVDPIEELCRILGETNADGPSDSGSHCAEGLTDQGGSPRMRRSALSQLFRPRRPLPVLRGRTTSRDGDLRRR